MQDHERHSGEESGEGKDQLNQGLSGATDSHI